MPEKTGDGWYPGPGEDTNMLKVRINVHFWLKNKGGDFPPLPDL